MGRKETHKPPPQTAVRLRAGTRVPCPVDGRRGGQGGSGEDSGSSPTPLPPALASPSLRRAAGLLSHQGFGAVALASGSGFWGQSELFLGLCLSLAISVENWSWAKTCLADRELCRRRESVWTIGSSATATDHGAALWELRQAQPASHQPWRPPGAQNLPGSFFFNRQMKKGKTEGTGPFPAVRAGG